MKTWKIVWILLWSWEEKCYSKYYRQNGKHKGKEWYINYVKFIFYKICYNKFEKLENTCKNKFT